MLNDLRFKLADLITPALLFVVNRKRGLRKHLALLGEHTIAIKLKRLERPFIIKISDGVLKKFEGPDEPEVIFKGDTLTFFKIALGVIDPDTAFFERKMVVEGSIPLSLLIKNAMDRFIW